MVRRFGGFVDPDAEALATRERVIAAQGVRAAQLRELQRGEVRVADVTTQGRL